MSLQASHFRGQLLLIVPARELAIVHLTNPDDPDYRAVSPHPDQISHLIELIFQAQER